MVPNLFLWYHNCSYGTVTIIMVPYLFLWYHICSYGTTSALMIPRLSRQHNVSPYGVTSFSMLNIPYSITALQMSVLVGLCLPYIF